MALVLNGLKLNPPVFLAPMAGITDSPSREIAKMFCPGLVVSEMIASSEKDKVYFESKIKENLSANKTNVETCPTAIQIAGHEIEWMTYAAKVIEHEGGELIDLNLGCPAKKIVGKFAGSALMREPTHTQNLIDSVVRATKLPVTVKMRLGWDEENMNAPMIAKSAEDSGVQMITVHARTRNQFFFGKADWSCVKDVKDVVSIPVIVNGDIIDQESAIEAINKSFADGIMVGRGAIGNPWLISELSAAVFGSNESKPADQLEMNQLISLHLDKTLKFYGKDVGLKIFRKHLEKYLKPFKLSNTFRRELLSENSIDEFAKKLELIF
ncbi:MAG: tRNA dihydrouridine synthase DusB [Rhodobacteraceae bacterium]|nr:MAG: tRNA dihydrouridine synthase DusB [Paracoccaceae bacterium]